jgi:hypothetical protein
MYPRTWSAIYTKAKHLGIKRAARKDWKFIAENYKPVIFPSIRCVQTNKKENKEAA